MEVNIKSLQKEIDELRLQCNDMQYFLSIMFGHKWYVFGRVAAIDRLMKNSYVPHDLIAGIHKERDKLIAEIKPQPEPQVKEPEPVKHEAVVVVATNSESVDC